MLRALGGGAELGKLKITKEPVSISDREKDSVSLAVSTLISAPLPIVVCPTYLKRLALAKQVLLMMELFAKDGSCKLLSGSSLPLTGLEVSSVYTDLAVFDFHHGQLTLREIVEGSTLRVLQAEIDTDFLVSPHLQLLQAPKLA